MSFKTPFFCQYSNIKSFLFQAVSSTGIQKQWPQLRQLQVFMHFCNRFDSAHQISAFAVQYQPLANHKAAENRLVEAQVW